MKPSFLPFLCIFLVFSCKKDTPPPEFEELNIDLVSQLDCDPEEENCAFISINIPWAANTNSRNKRINDQIESHVINLLDYQEENNFKSLESISQNFIDSYEAAAIEFPEYNIPWEASLNGRVMYMSEKIISIEFNLALFTGGAHGFTSISFLNIDPATGLELKNEDLFTAEFTGYVEDYFRRSYDIPANEPINSTGFLFNNDQFELPENIGFNQQKIILRYNVYEVASYAEGGIKIEIPKEEAREYLKI